MQSNYFPRVETIIVPRNVRTEFIGRYVSHRAAEILADVGLAGYNHKTVSIRTTHDLRVFHLMFDGFRPHINDEIRKQMFAPEEEEMDGTTNPGISGPVRGDELLAGRTQGRSRKNNAVS